MERLKSAVEEKNRGIGGGSNEWGWVSASVGDKEGRVLSVSLRNPLKQARQIRSESVSVTFPSFNESN